MQRKSATDPFSRAFPRRRPRHATLVLTVLAAATATAFVSPRRARSLDHQSSSRASHRPRQAAPATPALDVLAAAALDGESTRHRCHSTTIPPAGHLAVNFKSPADSHLVKAASCASVSDLFSRPNSSNCTRRLDRNG
ncbi:unnamed protein product [Cuscuta campestris]|uniref:Uncharacterized protein n=1 Tax=Cuscuta campestris TaxID=132261 RepID=A0A484N1D7_9ASTE|nr:unnamed protein product [Cuscuta campestris]